MNKKILAIIGIVAITAAVFAGCSHKDDAVDATASTDTTSQIAVSEESQSENNVQAEESTSAVDNSSDNSATESTAAKKENSSTSAKAAAGNTTTATKTTARQTTKAAAQTAKTTTKATTTVKNVSAKDVQAQVNSYIRSKGITVDSSLNPSNSGWSGQISGRQDGLNNGHALKTCKAYVDSEIAEMGNNISLYCYYDGDCFYICYMMNWG